MNTLRWIIAIMDVFTLFVVIGIYRNMKWASSRFENLEERIAIIEKELDFRV